MPTYLINRSFFVREITIPNLDDTRVLERLNLYIAKYEPVFLEEIFGYYFYKAFLTESNGYYNRTVLGLTIKNDEQIKVGLTPGLVSGTNTFTFDGTGGKPDYRGYDLVISEINGGTGILVKGVNFSWDYQLGVFTLLETGNVFQPNQYYNVHFENHPFSLTTSSSVVITQRMADLIFGKEYTVDSIPYRWKGLVHDENQSCIAYYVFYIIMNDMAQQMSTVNVSVVKTLNAVDVPPRDKMITAWNLMADECQSLLNFLWNNQSVYPEFNYYSMQHAARIFRRNSDFPF